MVHVINVVRNPFLPLALGLAAIVGVTVCGVQTLKSNERIGGLEATVVAVGTDSFSREEVAEIRGLNSDVRTLKNDVSALKDNYSALNGNVAGIGTAVSRIEARLVNADATAAAVPQPTALPRAAATFAPQAAPTIEPAPGPAATVAPTARPAATAAPQPTAAPYPPPTPYTAPTAVPQATSAPYAPPTPYSGQIPRPADVELWEIPSLRVGGYVRNTEELGQFIVFSSFGKSVVEVAKANSDILLQSVTEAIFDYCGNMSRMQAEELAVEHRRVIRQMLDGNLENWELTGRQTVGGVVSGITWYRIPKERTGYQTDLYQLEFILEREIDGVKEADEFYQVVKKPAFDVTLSDAISSATSK